MRNLVFILLIGLGFTSTCQAQQKKNNFFKNFVKITDSIIEGVNEATMTETERYIAANTAQYNKSSQIPTPSFPSTLEGLKAQNEYLLAQIQKSQSERSQSESSYVIKPIGELDIPDNSKQYEQDRIDMINRRASNKAYRERMEQEAIAKQKAYEAQVKFAQNIGKNSAPYDSSRGTATAQ